MRSCSFMRPILAENPPPWYVVWIEDPTVDAVLEGLKRAVAKGYHLNQRFAPFLQNLGPEHGYNLFGDFEDLHAAFSVEVPDDRVGDVIAALRAMGVQWPQDR